jgi:hypothetical protein
MIRVLGLDCATEDKLVGLAYGNLIDGRVAVQAAIPGSLGGVVQQLKAWIDPGLPTLLAIDEDREQGKAIDFREMNQGTGICDCG